MIHKTQSYSTTDGEVFPTLLEAKSHELTLLFADGKEMTGNHKQAAELCLEHADKVLDILKTKPSSRPAARKANDAVRKKRGATLTPTIQHSETEA